MGIKNPFGDPLFRETKFTQATIITIGIVGLPKKSGRVVGIERLWGIGDPYFGKRELWRRGYRNKEILLAPEPDGIINFQYVGQMQEHDPQFERYQTVLSCNTVLIMKRFQ